MKKILLIALAFLFVSGNVYAQSISDFVGKYKVISIFIGETNGVLNYYGPNQDLYARFKIKRNGKIAGTWEAEVVQSDGESEQIVYLPVTVNGKIKKMTKKDDGTLIANIKLTLSDGATGKARIRILPLEAIGKKQIYVKGSVTHNGFTGSITGLSYKPL